MGLSVSHGAFRGPYGRFMQWRRLLAVKLGIPPLDLMEGFYVSLGDKGFTPPTLYNGTGLTGGLELLDKGLPIKWECLKPNPLHELLWHSDCGGSIRWSICRQMAIELRKLAVKMGNTSDAEATIQFAEGCEKAYAEKKSLLFR